MLKYSLWVEIKLYQLSSSFCVSLMEKTVYDILFNFTLVGIMTFNVILKSQRRSFRWSNNDMVVSFAC